MTDTPERDPMIAARIQVSRMQAIWSNVETTVPEPGWIEYVRADIHAALLSETERLRAERDEARADANRHAREAETLRAELEAESLQADEWMEGALRNLGRAERAEAALAALRSPSGGA